MKILKVNQILIQTSQAAQRGTWVLKPWYNQGFQGAEQSPWGVVFPTKYILTSLTTGGELLLTQLYVLEGAHLWPWAVPVDSPGWVSFSGCLQGVCFHKLWTCDCQRNVNQAWKLLSAWTVLLILGTWAAVLGSPVLASVNLPGI